MKDKQTIILGKGLDKEITNKLKKLKNVKIKSFDEHQDDKKAGEKLRELVRGEREPENELQREWAENMRAREAKNHE